MKIWLAILLGLVQGIAEFLPISSSGHLAILQNPKLLNQTNPLLFDVLLHMGTLVAVIFAFRKDIADILRGLFRSAREVRGSESQMRGNSARRLFLMLVIATLPLAVVIPFQDKVDSLMQSLIFVGAMLILTGVLLFVSDRLARGRKTERSMRVSDAVAVGICQAIAVVPGLSRSGTTISAGMVSGLDREFAVKFSFLLSIPAVLGATVVSLFKALKEGVTLDISYLVGALVAMVVGYFAIGLVRSLAKKGKFGKFAYYCWAVGLLAIILNFVL